MDITAFDLQYKGKPYRRSQCRSCRNERSKATNRARYHADREFRERSARTTRNAAYKRRYGITADEFDAMVERQGGLCAICREAMTQPHLDHDHTTGQVRAALCYRCNMGIGYFRDSKRLLIDATRYIQAFQHLGATPTECERSSG